MSGTTSLLQLTLSSNATRRRSGFEQPIHCDKPKPFRRENVTATRSIKIRLASSGAAARFDEISSRMPASCTTAFLIPGLLLRGASSS